MTLYNDNDPFVCAWLRELIAAGHLPAGEVLSTPIEQLHDERLSASATFHAFAGIGGWPLALRLAGWPDEWPVWTGSCPCQPFSCAGQRRGTADKRHLWPAFRDLIAQHAPPVVFGEQVAGSAGREWLAGVRADLEALGYAVGAADLCVAGEGAPHIRQRLYWVAVAQRDTGRARRLAVQPGESDGANRAGAPSQLGRPSDAGGVDDPSPHRRQHESTLAGSDGAGSEPTRGREEPCARRLNNQTARSWRYGLLWGDSTLHKCLDGRTRRIPLEPALFPLVDGVCPARVGKLRGAGNAIVPQVAATFIRASLETLRELTL